jgi:chemotaxis protein methyltransferase CheR
VQQERPVDISEKAFARLVNILRVRTGFRLDVYKEQYIRRRIGIRLRACRCQSADDYGNLLVRDDGELEQLLATLTVTVSHFFRNPTTFDLLRQDILPELMVRAASSQGEVRIWSVGCAGGEEPYSLAILLRESFAEALDRTPVSIVATDVSRQALAMAERGTYPPERLQEVPPTVRDRHFVPLVGGYGVNDQIRAMVNFRRADLCMTARYQPCDLILCRNVLIYFEREPQERVVRAFASALGSGGILVLGQSETLPAETRSRFRTVSSSERVYRAI